MHIETLLCALGSLAGYSCQASVRELLVRQGGEPEEKVFLIANGKDGKRYFFGDALNKPLAESRYSVWSLAAGVATHLGCQQPVKVREIFAHVAATVGDRSSEFRESRRATGPSIRPPIGSSMLGRKRWRRSRGIANRHRNGPRLSELLSKK